MTDILHKPLPGAIVDTWQADATGTYPIQEQAQGQDKYDLRGKFTTDEQGRYWYTTVLPKPYTVPYDGPVGRLLRAGDRHAWRAAHLHYIIRAPGMRAITTEIFFENTEYLENDAVFGVRRSLIAKVEPVPKGRRTRLRARASAGRDVHASTSSSPRRLMDAAAAGKRRPSTSRGWRAASPSSRASMRSIPR